MHHFRAATAVSVALLFLLSGCVQITAREKIDDQGRAQVTVLLDLSRLEQAAQGNGFNSDFPGTVITDPQALCDAFLAGNSDQIAGTGSATDNIQQLSQLQCRPKGTTTLEILGQHTYPASVWTTHREWWGTRYRFEPGETGLIRIPSVEEVQGMSGETIAALKTAGFSFIYRIELPGLVSQAENGRIVNNGAEFDVLDLASQGQLPVAESMEPNVLVLIGAGILVILIIAGIAWWFWRRKKGPSPARLETTPRPQRRERPEQPLTPAPSFSPSPSTTRSTADQMPRRLRRFYRSSEERLSSQGEKSIYTAPRPTVPSSTSVSSTNDWNEEDLKGLLQENVSSKPESSTPLASPRSRRSEQTSHAEKKSDDWEALAERIAQEGEKETKTQQELDALKKKLSTVSASGSVTEKGNEARQPTTARERHRQRRAEKGQAETSSIPGGSSATTAPSASQQQLEELKKMDFKDLLGEEKEKKKKGREEKEDDLETLEEEEGEETLEADDTEEEPKEGEELQGLTEQCPSCKKESETILYCPECGTGFCPACAASFKKQGDQEYYTCPKCQTPVKKTDF